MKKPKLGHSIFEGAWIDWNPREGYGAAERYYCSGVIQDMTGVVYFIMHNEHSLNSPQFFLPEQMSDIKFAAPQPPEPHPDMLFSEDIPFWIETESRGKAQ